ncbi:MAG: hypothetical protein OEM67_03160 [Thermoleophilia bacterium]|nr:hypothetical protein [Thermoleophilia bacterium]MDH3724307.1 hypothetical protein [Thermoleophilia bacterium]
MPQLARIIDAAKRELTRDKFGDFAASLSARTAPLAHGTHPGPANPNALAALSARALAQLGEAESIIASVASSGSVGELARVATCVQAHLTRASPTPSSLPAPRG